GLARSTVCDYLAGFVRLERPASLAPWVDEETVLRVTAAARQVGGERLKPIYLALGGEVPYDVIRLGVAEVGGQGAWPGRQGGGRHDGGERRSGSGWISPQDGRAPARCALAGALGGRGRSPAPLLQVEVQRLLPGLDLDVLQGRVGEAPVGNGEPPLLRPERLR